MLIAVEHQNAKKEERSRKIRQPSSVTWTGSVSHAAVLSIYPSSNEIVFPVVHSSPYYHGQIAVD